jgi:hypothetical protein
VHMIHSVGPDLRKNDPTREQALAVLMRAYANTLNEFLASECAVLRLLPISGGIFAGDFLDQMPELTQEALEAAFRSLPPPKQALLRRSSREVHLCIFMGGEMQAWEAAGWRRTTESVHRSNEDDDTTADDPNEELVQGVEPERLEYLRRATMVHRTSEMLNDQMTELDIAHKEEEERARLEKERNAEIELEQKAALAAANAEANRYAGSAIQSAPPADSETKPNMGLKPKDGALSRSARGRAQKPIMVEVATLTGAPFFVKCYGGDTIAALKNQIEEQEGIPPDQQRLLFSAKLLSDDMATLYECGIKDSAVLQLVVRSRELKQHHKRWSATNLVTFSADSTVKSGEELGRLHDQVDHFSVDSELAAAIQGKDQGNNCVKHSDVADEDRSRIDSSNSVYSEFDVLKSVKRIIAGSNSGGGRGDEPEGAQRSDDWYIDRDSARKRGSDMTESKARYEILDVPRFYRVLSVGFVQASSSLDSDVLRQLSKGHVIKALARKGDWLRLQDPGGVNPKGEICKYKPAYVTSFD